MFSLGRLWSVVVKEFIQIGRDPRTLAIIVVLPVVQMLIFGYAINTSVDHIPTVVYDQAQDRSSREFVQKFINSGYFDYYGEADSPDAVRSAIDRGNAKVGLIIPPDFSRALASGTTATAQMLIDGTDPNIAQTALFAGGNVAQALSISLVGKNRALDVPIDLRPSVLYNPSMLSVNAMIPGLVGLIIQFQTLLLTAFAIVRERERGTLEQLIVTPIKPLELLLGKLLPYTAIAFFNVAMVLLVGRFWFGVDLVGSLPLLLVLSGLFVMSSLGIGMLLSTVSQTQVQAVQMAMFFMLPSVLLSGFLFPQESMPPPLRDVSYLIPLTYFLHIVRGIMLKGIGLADLWPDVLPLTIFGILVFGVAVSRFRKVIA